MKKFLTAFALILVISSPAMAASHGYHGGNNYDHGASHAVNNSYRGGDRYHGGGGNYYRGGYNNSYYDYPHHYHRPYYAYDSYYYDPYYAPPPVVYAPAPVYQEPGIGVEFGF